MTYHLLTNNDCSTINNINKIFDSLTKQIQTHNIQHIIIPSKYFLSFGATAILNLIELLANQIHGSIIIDLSTHHHFEEAKKTIQHILSHNKKNFHWNIHSSESQKKHKKYPFINQSFR